MRNLGALYPALEHYGTALTVRYEFGRVQREKVPLKAHAEVTDVEDRLDPLAVLAQQDKRRLPELIPLRYGRMSATPFTFLRGAAAVMARDLATEARTALHAELCGHAHLGNFRYGITHPTASWCSTATTLTRPSLGRLSGTSSGWPPV